MGRNSVRLVAGQSNGTWKGFSFRDMGLITVDSLELAVRTQIARYYQPHSTQPQVLRWISTD
jgi:hypothetical protein